MSTFYASLALGLAIFVILLFLNLRKYKKLSTTLHTRVEQLAKYEALPAAEATVEGIKRAALAHIEKTKLKAREIKAEATRESEAIKQEAFRRAAEIEATANQTLAGAEARMVSAESQAVEIIERANRKADEIAGHAYAAMRDAELYEKSVRAMKNIVEGYGDTYLIPSHSLLDDLSDHFGHTQAGEQLKRCRTRVKSMIQERLAATCDYVEANRKETAIRFVIDAFNGKVDSTLSRVRHDNIGTLSQEIRDAFALVNLHGKAFRSARITTDFLDARLLELKWAATAQQLKLDEREQQRRIKEQIREEQKARRDYEKALRETAREEEIIRKAMEKAQKNFANANAEQREEFEKQLVELTQRLTEAEDRNRRALSMAQQTKKGHVYIISNIGSFGEHIYKIGLTRRLEPLDRIRELGDSSVPFEFDVHALIMADDAPALETKLHKCFVMNQVNKINHRKEFFRVNIMEIKNLIDRLNLSASWTLTAEAREYHESMAIEKQIQSDPVVREAWTKRQIELEEVDQTIEEAIEEVVESV